jgi:hypothetical protein
MLPLARLPTLDPPGDNDDDDDGAHEEAEDEAEEETDDAEEDAVDSRRSSFECRCLFFFLHFFAFTFAALTSSVAVG